MIIKSELDTSNYKRINLPNGISVLLVSNESFTKASLAVSVLVGSFDEPEEFPGLAHFLEHMLFMGTDKYKGEHEFNEFLGQNNGYTNAYTADTMTVYYCDIDSSQLEKCADMFSSFFTSPLFNEDTVNREICAVDSEYLNTLNSPYWRSTMLLKEFMKKDAPEKRFNCGNKDTLRKEEGVLEKVKKFYKTKYSSDLMNLVICSNDSIEKLEQVARLFSEIPNKNLKTKAKPVCDITNSEYRNIFDDKFFSKIIQFAPKDDNKGLNIYIAIPPIRQYYKVNPLSYIEFIFKSSEPGYLLSELKNEELGFEICLQSDHFDDYTLISIEIKLTEKGVAEYLKVLNMVKSYISSIKPNESEYNRLRKIMNTDFLYLQSKTPIEISENLVPNMYYYPDEYLLNVEYVFEDYNPKLIELIICHLSDHRKWIVTLADKNGKFNLREKYYDVEYSVFENIDLKSAIADNKICLKLGDPNNDSYLENIKIINGPKRSANVKYFDNGKIYFVFDSEFNIPKSQIRINLRSNLLKSKFIPIKIYLDIAYDYLMEKYARQLINYHLSMSINCDIHGIYFTIEGISTNIIEMAKILINELYEISLDRFDVMRRKLENKYAKILSSSPYRRFKDVLRSKIYNSSTIEELFEKTKTIRKEEVHFIESFYTEIVAVGNLEHDKVEDLYKSIESQCSYVPEDMTVHFKEVSFKTFDKENNLIAMLFRVNDGAQQEYISEGEYDFEEFEESQDDRPEKIKKFDYNTAVGELIHNICNEEFFKQLRTEEQLGYIVCTNFCKVKTNQFLAFIVQSAKSVEFLENRITEFVEYLKNMIDGMSDDLFETYKASLISNLEEPILNMEELTESVTQQIELSRLDLNYNRKIISIVNNLTKNDLIHSKIFDNYIKLYSIRD